MQLTVVAPFGFKDFPESRTLPFICRWGLHEVHVVRDFECKRTAPEILKLLSDQGLTAESYHADFGEDFDLTVQTTRQRRVVIDNLTVEADFAVELGVGIVVVHSCGREGTPTADLTDSFLQSAEAMARVAEARGIRCVIENMPPNHLYGQDAGKLGRAIRGIGSEHLGMCFDTGHAHMNGIPVARQIAETQGFIHYIHAHDNNGNEDQHLLPFTGSIDWTAVEDTLRTFGYNGPLCLEVFESTDALESKLTTSWWDRLNAFVGRQ